MADRLILSEIAVDCRLGVYEWEQKNPQTIWIDIEAVIDVPKAAASDDVKDAVDYAALVAAVRKLAQGKPYHLMETLAEDAAALVLGETRTPWVRVRIKKKALQDVGYAAVDVVRLAGPSIASPRRRRLKPRRTR
jgi:7,8-dihydroneopterin aldolase/epimerase/oxygenase